MSESPTPSKQRLSSWKEIAEYLGTTVRNAQRWRDGGLPVHNHPVAKNVWALTEELDAWMAQRGEATLKSRSPTRRWLIGAGTLAAGTSIGWLGARRAAPVVSAAREFRRVTTAPELQMLSGTGPAGSAVWSSDGKMIYVQSTIASQLTRLDTGTWKPSGRIQLPAQPVRLIREAVRPGALFCLDMHGGIHQMAEWMGSAHLFAKFESQPYTIALAPDDSSLYVTAREQGLIRIALPTKTQSVLTRRGHVYQAQPDATGEFVLVSYLFGGPEGRTGHDTFEVIHAATGKLVKRFNGLPSSGAGPSLHWQRNEWWVVLGDGCSRPEYDHDGCPGAPSIPVIVVDAKTLESSPMFAVPGNLLGPLQFSPCGSLAYLPGNHSIGVLDAATKQLRGRLPVGLGGHIAFRHESDQALIPLQGAYNEPALLQWRMPVTLKVNKPAKRILVPSSPEFDPREVDSATVRLNGLPPRAPTLVYESQPDEKTGGYAMRIPVDDSLLRPGATLRFHAVTFAGMVLRGEVQT